MDDIPYTAYENHPHLLEIRTNLGGGGLHPHYSWDEFELQVAADMLAERGFEVAAELLRKAHMSRTPVFSEGWGLPDRATKLHYFTLELREYIGGYLRDIFRSHCRFERRTVWKSSVAVYPLEFLPDDAKANLCSRCKRKFDEKGSQ